MSWSMYGAHVTSTYVYIRDLYTNDHTTVAFHHDSVSAAFFMCSFKEVI